MWEKANLQPPAIYTRRPKRRREESSLPFLRVLGSRMPDPSGSSTAEVVAVASAMTLTPPQLGEVEKDSQDVEAQPSAGKEKAHEDEEWLENPANPRNWPSRKKWTNMAIVSIDPCQCSSGSPQRLISVILGVILHVLAAPHKFDDGPGSTADR